MVALKITYQWSDFRSTSQLRDKCVVIFGKHECKSGILRGYCCFASSNYINIQLQQMFAFFIRYQRWATEYTQMLNIAVEFVMGPTHGLFLAQSKRGLTSIITTRQFHWSTFNSS